MTTGTARSASSSASSCPPILAAALLILHRQAAAEIQLCVVTKHCQLSKLEHRQLAPMLGATLLVLHSGHWWCWQRAQGCGAHHQWLQKEQE